MEATPKIEPMAPIYTGRLCRGTTCVMRIVEPENIPAFPRPAIARPTMKATEFGAVAHTRDPISNITIEARKTFFVE